MKSAAIVIALLAFFLVSQARAESIKCDDGFVSIGAAKVEVLMRCGEPFFVDVISGEDQFKIEQWAYEQKGYRSFIRILTFRGGVLTDISVGDRK